MTATNTEARAARNALEVWDSEGGRVEGAAGAAQEPLSLRRAPRGAVLSPRVRPVRKIRPKQSLALHR